MVCQVKCVASGKGKVGGGGGGWVVTWKANLTQSKAKIEAGEI